MIDKILAFIAIKISEIQTRYIKDDGSIPFIGNIKYKGAQSTYSMISFIDSGETNGPGVSFNGGKTIITKDGDILMYIDQDASSGTDYEIITALKALGWDSDCIV